MSTLVVGLGNPYLGDDGVGWRIVQEAERLLGDRQPVEDIKFLQASLGGISLMEMLIGFDKAIIVDTIQSENHSTGKLRRLSIGDLPSRHSNAAHEASFKDALRLGTKLGAKLPSHIAMIAVEIESQVVLSENLSLAVEESILPAARLVLSEIT